MPDQLQWIADIQAFFGEGAKPFFWACNTFWGLGAGVLLPAFLFWLGYRRIGFRAGLFTIVAGILGDYAKWVIAEPRPFYVSDVFTPLKVSTGFGMPSGNALGIAALMVTIAVYARRRWVWGVAGVLILCVGLARVYYGVHSPAQVLVGWVAGIAIAVTLVQTADPLRAWFRAKRLPAQLALVAVAALLATVVGLWIHAAVLQDYVIPQAWVDRYEELAAATDEEDPFHLFNALDSYVVGGLVLGFGAAGVLLVRDAVPRTEGRLALVLHAVLGLLLYQGFRWAVGAATGGVAATAFYPPFLVLAYALLPVVIYVLPAMVVGRLGGRASPAG